MKRTIKLSENVRRNLETAHMYQPADVEEGAGTELLFLHPGDLR